MSPLYLFGDPVKAPPPVVAPSGLSPEESEIYKRLNDRVTKEKEKEKDAEEDVVKTNTDSFLNSYLTTMRSIQGV